MFIQYPNLNQTINKWWYGCSHDCRNRESEHWSWRGMNFNILKPTWTLYLGLGLNDNQQRHILKHLMTIKPFTITQNILSHHLTLNLTSTGFHLFTHFCAVVDEVAESHIWVTQLTLTLSTDISPEKDFGKS